MIQELTITVNLFVVSVAERDSTGGGGERRYESSVHFGRRLLCLTECKRE